MNGARWAPRPPGAEAAGPLLVVLGGWLVIAPYLLLRTGVDSSNDAKLQEYGVAVVLVLAGLWLQRHQGSPAAVAAAAVGGAVLLLAAVVAPEGLLRIQLNDAICGGLAVLLAGLAWTGRGTA